MSNIGTTNDNKKKAEDISNKTKYKIVCHFITKSKGMKKGKKYMYNKIVEDERINFGLGIEFQFPHKTALSRIRRKNLEGINNHSPLHCIEPKLVSLILRMSKMKHSLTVSEGLLLTNEFISGTQVQEDLINRKIKRNIYYESDEDLGKVEKN